MTRSELEDRVAVLLGGRVAEELIYGEISTGAHNDLERATELARLMVMKYGMSERVGLATFGDRMPMFLKGPGAPWGGERDYSEATARTIDEEVRGILDRTYDRVRGILTTKKAVLVAAATELKRTETLEGERLRRVLAGDGVSPATATGSGEPSAR
jgi:cell division protease FtsH